MIRALGDAAPRDARARADGRPAPSAVLYCNVGDVTNLAVARGRSCLFTRVSPVGLEEIAGGLAVGAGLAPNTRAVARPRRPRAPVEEIEGDPETVAAARSRARGRASPRCVDELRLSLDFYGAQEAAVPVERIVLCGPGSAIPGLAERDGARPRPADLGRPPGGARRASTPPPPPA